MRRAMEEEMAKRTKALLDRQAMEKETA